MTRPGESEHLELELNAPSEYGMPVDFFERRMVVQAHA